MALLAALAPGEEGGASRVLEDLTDTLASPGRALEVVPRADPLSHRHTLREMEESGVRIRRVRSVVDA